MHSFRKGFLAALTVLLTVGLLLAADFVLYPCTFIRNDVHAVTTQTYDDVFLGTSHGKMNIDPLTVESVTGKRGHNLCVGGEYPIDTYYLTKLMIESGHKPARIVYEISPGYFVSTKEEGNNYLLFYHEFPLSKAKLSYFASSLAKCNFRTMLFPWYEYPLSTELKGLKENISKKWNQDYSADTLKTETQEYHESGFVERYPVDPATFSFDGMSEYHTEDLIGDNLLWMDRMVTLCTANDIELITLMTPLPAVTLRQFSAGYEAMGAWFAQWFAARNVTFWNFNGMDLYALTDHSVERFTDLDGHMNGDAARAFSTVLGTMLDGEQQHLS